MVDENEFNIMDLEGDLLDEDEIDENETKSPIVEPQINKALSNLEKALLEERPEHIKEFVRHAMYELGYF